MEKGAKFTCRCPACGSRDVNLYEHFIMTDLYEVRGGRLEDRISSGSPSATGEVDGVCVKCPHKWRLRKNAILSAEGN